MRDAPREVLEQELMRAMDVIDHLESALVPLTRLTDMFIMGRDGELDRMLGDTETPVT